MAAQADRYRQLLLLIIAAGTIYPIPYLRQNFENSMLDAFSITREQLADCSALLGVVLFVTYLPSGWLADRVAPNRLLGLSMAGAGAIALWMASSPDFMGLKLAFAGLGIFSGLTLWGSLIKTTSLIAPHDQQGRFFGLLESGRGVIEASLATLALVLFAHYMDQNPTDASPAISAVLTYYGCIALGLSPVVFCFLGHRSQPFVADGYGSGLITLGRDLKTILAQPSVWLATIIILVGYQIFWVTYSFAGFLESVHALSAVTVGTITVARLWMRPIGPVVAGLVGDRFHTVRFLSWLMLAAALTLVTLPLLPSSLGTVALLAMVLVIALVTYGIRGVYWATLDDCDVGPQSRGLAIGFISVIAYTPDIYVPVVQTLCLNQWEGPLGYTVYYGLFAFTGLLGFAAARRLAWLSER